MLLTYIGGQSHVFCHQNYMPMISSAQLQLKLNCSREEFYHCSDMVHKCCICNKYYNSYNKENILYIEPIINCEEKSDDEEGYSIGIDNNIDKFRYFTASVHGNKIDKRNGFNDGDNGNGLFNDIIDTNNDDSNVFHNYRDGNDKL